MSWLMHDSEVAGWRLSDNGVAHFRGVNGHSFCGRGFDIDADRPDAPRCRNCERKVKRFVIAGTLTPKGDT